MSSRPKKDIISVIIIVISAIAVLVGGALWAVQATKPNVSANTISQPKDSPIVLEGDLPQEKRTATNAKTPDGTYRNYSQPAFDNTRMYKRVLFFYSSDCEPCGRLEADIKANGLPKGVAVLKVDFDSSAHLRERYDVAGQGMFVRISTTGTKLKSITPAAQQNLSGILKALGI